jgi:hypothetical protein
MATTRTVQTGRLSTKPHTAQHLVIDGKNTLCSSKPVIEVLPFQPTPYSPKAATDCIRCKDIARRLRINILVED